MPLIGFANTKGGQGKTTWGCSTAAFLEAELLDLNPENGDAHAWALGAKHPARLIYPDDLATLADIAKAKAWAVADCPPWNGKETRAVLALSRAVVIPVAAGYQDLRGLARMMELVEEARSKANPELITAIIGNGRRAVAFTETWEKALESYHKPKERTFYLGSIPQRQAIVDAFGAHLPAFMATEPAGHEAKELMTKIVSLLHSKKH